MQQRMHDAYEETKFNFNVMVVSNVALFFPKLFVKIINLGSLISTYSFPYLPW